MKKKRGAEASRIADQLRRAFDGKAWHGDALWEILKDVGAKQAAGHPVPNAHSIWELVLHIAAWDGVVRKRMAGVAAKLPAEKNFPLVTDRSEAAWKAAVAHARRAHEELIDAVEKFPDQALRRQVPGKRGAHYNFYYMLHGLAQHVAYHAGQIALLKKM